MKLEKEKLIILFIRFAPLLFIISLSFLLTYFISIEHYQNLKIDKQDLKERFINNNKNNIKANINSTENYINNELSLSISDLKNSIKLEVYNGHRIMTSIYNTYKNSKSQEEIKDLIKSSLKDIRFNDNRGYLFLYNLRGTSILHPSEPSREGKNFFNDQDVNGTYIIRESINIANNKSKEGFQNWFFNKTLNDKKEYEKIGFIKKFEPYDWFIGSGEYVEDFKVITKNKILNHISNLKYVNNNYIFVIDYDGNVLVTKNKKNTDSKIFKTERISNYKVFINSTNKSKFVGYKVKDSNNHEYIKYSYLKKIDNFNFVIGLEFNSDNANVFIKKRTGQLEKVFSSNLRTLFISSLIITSILLFISYYISKYFEKLFKEYKNTLNRKNLLLLNAQTQAKIGSWEQTNDNNTLTWSNEVYNIFEIDIKDNSTFDTFINIVHPDDKNLVISTFQNSVKEHTEYYLEHRLIFDGSRIKYVIERASHLYNTNNNHISTLGTIQDITSRKEAEISLQESARQYKSLMEQAPYSIEIFDENGLQIGVNKAHGKLWGFDTSKTLKKFNILEDKNFKKSGMLPFIKKAYAGEIVDIAAHKFDPVVSTTYTNGLGKTKIIKTQIYPIQDINKKVKSIIVTQIDVSAEEEVAQRDRILNSVFEAVPDLLLILNNDGKIIDCRAQENSDVYVNIKTFLGKSIGEVLSLNIGNIFNKNIKNLLRDEKLKIFKYKLAFNGEIKYFEARMAKLPLDEYIMTIVRDITVERKMREDNLKQEKIFYQQSKMAAMGEMLGNIAHQWRQPLSTISTLATGSKLQKEMNCLSDKQLMLAFNTINNSAQYLSETIEDFRSFFDPSNNKISEFLISNAIEKTLSLLSSQFKDKNIEIIKNIEKISVSSIENELIQVLVNLLNNSRDALLNFKEEKRYIFIDVYKEKKYFIIEIKDNGKGISSDIIDRVFEPYFTTKHKAQGTGIGLYMSEEIIRTHLNGTILVNNETYEHDENIYKGAKFTIKIKIKAEND